MFPTKLEVERKIVSELAVVPDVINKLPEAWDTPWPDPVAIVLKKVESALACVLAKVQRNSFC